MDLQRTADTARLLDLLADAWLLEPDPPLLQRLSALPQLAPSLEKVTPEELAISYTEVVLQLVPPYASLFLSEDGMLNADPAEEALRVYVRSGFELPSDWRAGAPDHLGVELHFVAFMLGRDPAQAAGFLRQYLLPWAPVCCLAIERAAQGGFYAALARLTLDVLLSLEEEAG